MKVYQDSTLPPNNAQNADPGPGQPKDNPHAHDNRLGVAYGVLAARPLTNEENFRKVHEYFEKSDLDPLGKLLNTQAAKPKAKPDGGYGGATDVPRSAPIPIPKKK